MLEEKVLGSCDITEIALPKIQVSTHKDNILVRMIVWSRYSVYDRLVRFFVSVIYCSLNRPINIVSCA